MTSKHVHLAQLNVARARAPKGHPSMESFFGNVEYINALAESAPGFIWRLKDEGGDATEIQVFADPLLLVNLSVWEDMDTLRRYVYDGDHMSFVRRRLEWFDRPRDAHMVLWWIPAGSVPDVADARGRLELLQKHGPGPEAFTFKNPSPPPGAE